MDFLRGLARVTKNLEWTCLAYCLMNSHYHLIMSTMGCFPRRCTP